MKMRSPAGHVALAVGALVLPAMPTSVDASTIAVTEFLVNPGEVESSEWVELFNYGADAVDLTGWSIADEFGDVAPLPEVIVPSGGFLVLTANRPQFLADWFSGANLGNVHEMATNFALNNSVDQVYIRNDQNQVVWNLAYQNDDTTGLATFLTVDDFSITDYGTMAEPGISRSGDDLGMAGFLGYQQNDFTTDPFAFTSTPGDVGSPLAGGYTAIPSPAGLALLGIAATCRRRRPRET